MGLRPIDTDLWVAEQPLRFAGIELGSRMTVVRLPSGGLWIHSPIRSSVELLREVEKLGAVEALVAPNRFHHLFAGDWLRAHPRARLHLAPGLASKRPELEAHEELGETPDPAWGGVLSAVALRGMPLVNEVVFHHEPSRTLIAADLAFNIGAESPLATRIAFRLIGAYGRLAPSFLERLLVRDRRAFRESLQRVLSLPFERVIVAHGAVADQGGRESLRKGYDWVLES